MKKIFLICLSAVAVLTGCEDVFEPAVENKLELENAYANATYAQGLLLNGYNRIPTNSWTYNDVATDNAVSNDRANGYRKIATGQWTSSNNPLNQWSNSRAAIQYLNLFLQVNDSVNYAIDEEVNKMFIDRMKGEALGLRALFMFHLLEAHAGRTTENELLGVPIVLEPENLNSDFNQPRASFEACMKQIYSDLDKAEELLPLDFENIASDAAVPEKYAAKGRTKDDYNRVFGETFRLRMTKRIAKGIRAKAALLAASPAYSDGNTTTWADAANYAADVIDLNGGLNGLPGNGYTWYVNTAEIDAVASGTTPKEILWRGNLETASNSVERENYPPTLFGNGRVNPTQNLVDAFPMANGYPIADGAAGYDATKPYDNRDPRLLAYVLVNGSKAGVNSSVINTASDATTNDGLNKVETSTRTGYYMRKLMRQDINLSSSSTTTQKRYQPRIRYTEIYLIYAEAANEAWGPTGNGGRAYSAYDVIKKIRNRAGVGISNGDAYLESIKGDQEKMRELIRNERRLELCFEGFRFWDLRRWKANINETANGVSIVDGAYEIIPVESRDYKPYMIYGPIPYSETLKYDQLMQNQGW
ncbi:putative outer membrane starch-binding protein [Breznakibacter xylanolyticus]|uniref:Putative outer membrane starch-binding protein n=1 Tax=Breznakibacter xylanolyticus TaxID=990 RepID=A0A2W7Q686_9BACT|nr:RagB/SusD family nutrient uptake outer membrane protein [Breznakibacter xylanolyticus]PZX17249.1 putative outer membrane starch-binding protein [Breznakibacter xylanolyticus]